MTMFIEDIPHPIGLLEQQTIGYQQQPQCSASIPITSPDLANALGQAKGFSDIAHSFEDQGLTQLAKIFEQAASAFVLEANFFEQRDKQAAEIAANAPPPVTDGTNDGDDTNVGSIDTRAITGG